jgi:hypothetical protein
MVEVVHCRRCYPPWGKPGDVMIDRTTKWGNPFLLGRDGDRDAVCNAYERYFREMEARGALNIAELFTAQRLGCWCKPQRCHGDYLKKRIDQAMGNNYVDEVRPPPKKLTLKDFGITHTKLESKSGSYINEKGDLVKTYKRKKKSVKPKTKRKICRCKK